MGRANVVLQHTNKNLEDGERNRKIKQTPVSRQMKGENKMDKEIIEGSVDEPPTYLCYSLRAWGSPRLG